MKAVCNKKKWLKKQFERNFAIVLALYLGFNASLPAKRSTVKIFTFINLIFLASQALGSSLELKCLGESDLPNFYYGKEALGKAWHFGLESKLIGFYFTLNEPEKTGKVTFVGIMNSNNASERKSFNLVNLRMSERFISAKVKIDIDRKGAFEIDRGSGMFRFWSQSWPKSVSGTCEKSPVLAPKF